MTISGSEDLGREIARLLAMTKVFSKSFDIRRERVRNWQLVGLLMALGTVQKNRRATASAFRTQIRELVEQDGNSADQMYQWQYKFAYEFKNPNGWFLQELPAELPPREPPTPMKKKARQKKQTGKRRPPIKSYQLTPLFQACEHAYVQEFLESRTQELGTSVSVERDDPRTRELFKTIVLFQRDHYLPLWKKLTVELQDLCAVNQHSADGLTKWAWRAPLWAVLLASWQHKLEKPKQWFQSTDANRFAVDALADGSSADDCLEMLSEDPGCQILKRERHGFEELYILNDEYEPALLNYTRPLPSLNQRLNQELLGILQK